MGTKTIPQLSAASAIGDTDVFEVDQGAGSLKVTGLQLKTYGAKTFPFFGTRPLQTPWVRPGLSIGGGGNNFTRWLNQGTGIANGDLYVAQGSGYTVGDILTLVGGSFTRAAQIGVFSVNGSGAVTQTFVADQGDYSVLPANPVSCTGGTGVGATFSATLMTLSKATATDNSNGLPLVVEVSPADNSSFCATGLLKPIGNPPWTISVAAAAMSQYFDPVGPGSGGPVFLPLMLVNSSDSNTDLMDFLAIFWSKNGYIDILKYASAGSPPMTPTLVGLTKKASPFSDYLEWFRVENDGTNLVFSISSDGLFWFPIYQEALTTFIQAVDHVGFGFDRLNTATSPLNIAAILWDWEET